MELLRDVHLVRSPVFELIASMFRLQCHEHLTRQESAVSMAEFDLDLWVERVRQDLSDSDREDLQTFFDFESFLGLAMVRFAWQTDSWRSVRDFLAQIDQTPAHDLFAEFLCTGYAPNRRVNVASPDDVRDYINQTNLPPTERWKLAYLYLNADRTKERFGRLVAQCNDRYFTRDWERLAQIESDSADLIRARIHTRRDLVDYFPYMAGHPVEDAHTTVVLAPSVFYHVDSLSSSADEGGLFVTLYGTEFRSWWEIGADELSEFLKVIADDTRVKIIKTLGTGAYFGYELAQRLNLSSSTISHHLAQLATIGIIVPTRQENRVSYELNRDRLATLMASLTTALTR